MKFIQGELEGVYIVEPPVFEDNRGAFIKMFHNTTFEDMGLQCSFKESYYSESRKEVIRGMHFQLPPQDHAKLVYVVLGKVLDVVLDIRKSSPTYGKHVAVELSDVNKKGIYIPPGFAHGFSALSSKAIVVSLQTSIYSPDHDAGVRWDSFGMNWGIEDPVLSQRDRSLPRLEGFDTPFN